MKDYHLNQSLEEIENEKWDKPDTGSSLVNKVHYIRKKLLKDLTTEDIRLMVGQQFSLEYIIPLALRALEKNPFQEGDFYPGDLLVRVLSVKYEFWKTRPELLKEIKQIILFTKEGLINFENNEEAFKLINGAIDKFYVSVLKNQ